MNMDDYLNAYKKIIEQYKQTSNTTQFNQDVYNQVVSKYAFTKDWNNLYDDTIEPVVVATQTPLPFTITVLDFKWEEEHKGHSLSFKIVPEGKELTDIKETHQALVLSDLTWYNFDSNVKTEQVTDTQILRLLGKALETYKNSIVTAISIITDKTLGIKQTHKYRAGYDDYALDV